MTNESGQHETTKHRNGWRTFGIVIISVLVTLCVGYWVVTVYLFPSKFSPTQLNDREQVILEQKLKAIGVSVAPSKKRSESHRPELKAEAYNESSKRREIFFTEKEINSLLAKNTQLADKLVFDFSANLASAKLLIKLDPDFPVMGGKTIKVTTGIELSVHKGKPRAILRGVSIWGVPLPNAWLGNLKNKDMFAMFGDAGGFWQALQEGVEEIDIQDGRLKLKLKE